MLDQDTKQAALQQFKKRWDPSSPPAPKSKWDGLRFKPSPEIAGIPEMDDAQFEQLKISIAAAAAEGKLDQMGKIFLRKNQQDTNPGQGQWEIFSGRSRYRALSELRIDPQPFLKFVGASKRSMLSLAIEDNVEHRAWASTEDLEKFLTLADAAMEALKNKDGVKK